MNVSPLETVLVSLESGARPAGGASVDSGEIASVGGEHLDSDGGFDFRSIKRIPRSFFESLRGGRIAPRDILVVKDGATTGKTAFVREDFPFVEAAVNEHVFCVRVDQAKASPEYVFHFLRSPLGQTAINLDFRGATVGGISRQFASKTRLPLPPLSDQRRIAEILDNAASLRAKRRAAIAQLNTLTHSIFLDMFGDPEGRSQRFQSDVLDNVCSLFAGFAWRAARFSKDPVGLPIIRIQNVDAVRDWDVVYWPDPYDTRFVVHKGDILLTLSGSFRIAQWPGEDALLNQRIVRVDAKPDIERRWLLHAMRLLVAKIERLGRHALVNNVALTDLKQLQLIRPPMPLQSEFVHRVESVDNLEASMRASLSGLDGMFSSLQHRAFGGQL